MRRAIAALAAGLGLVTAWTVPAQAQTEVERFERQLEQIQRETRLEVNEAIPPGQRALIDYGLSLSFNFAAIDDSGQNTHILRQTQGIGYLRLDVDQVHQVLLRVRSTYNDWNSGDSFEGTGDDWIEPTLDRAVYRFDLARYLARYEGRVPDHGMNLVLEGGRQLVHWVNGLVLSEELDGARIILTYDPLQLEILAAVTRDSITDIDSSRPRFAKETDRGFYGGLLSWQASEQHRPFIYGLVQDDQNDRETRTDTIGGVPVTTTFEYDSWYLGLGSTGRLSDRLIYSAEIVYQGGRALSSSFTTAGGVVTAVPQRHEDISAFALDMQLEYILPDVHATRWSAELVLATGDDDRLTTTNTLGGNRPGTDDNAFNAFGLINTGFAFAPDVSNLVALRGGVATYPWPNSECFRRLQLGLNLFAFGKLDADAPIGELTSSDFYLGTELDFYANWRVTSDLSWALRYGVFFPGEAIAADRQARHFLFSGITLAF